MKVCHILSGDLWAGAETMAYNLINHLNGFQDLTLFVIILNKGRLYKELMTLGINVYLLSESHLSFYGLFCNIKKIIGTENPDVVHAHRYKENFLAFICLKRPSRTVLISTQHGMPELYQSGFGFKKLVLAKMNQYLLKYFFKLICVSNEIYEKLLQEHSFKKENIAVIHNGIVIPVNLNIGRRRDDQMFSIGSAGRLSPVKDFALLVEIAKLVRKNNCKIYFKLAGDGPEMSSIKKMVDDNGISDSFEFLGHVEDIFSFYNDLDVYINTSVHEGIPMSVLEAMGSGLPVVVPLVGGFPEIIDNEKDGFLIKERTPELFAEKCLLLYKNKLIYNNVAKNAQLKVGKKFSVENMAQKYFLLYKALI